MASISKMSLVAQYDDLRRYTSVLTTSGSETEFQTFTEIGYSYFRKLKEAQSEVENLKETVSSLRIEIERSNTKNMHLKNLLEDSVSARRKVESEKNNLASQIATIREVVLADNAVGNHTKEKLAFLSSTCKVNLQSPPKLQTIEESAGSLFSLSDIDQTDDDLGNTRRSSNRRRRRSRGKRSSSESRASLKKKKLDDVSEPLNNENDLYTVPMKPLGRCNSEPTAITPDIPKNFDQFHNTNSVQSKYNMYHLRNTRSLSVSTPNSKKVTKNHAFVSKTIINRLKCYPCGHNIGYLKQALKCSNCRMICHPECKEKCALPCLPIMCTPTKGNSGTIADYTSSTSPMIPPLIVHCINEIESRGLIEDGIYRKSGNKNDVKNLKEKFLNGRTFPSLNDIPDIHVVCDTLKGFLSSLKEPLIPSNARQAFVHAAEIKNETQSLNALKKVVEDLPQPNCDTLAFLIIHLQKVVESPKCKMTIENLAIVFAPTVVGYSMQNPDLYSQSSEDKQVIRRLLSIPTEYWENLLNIKPENFQGILKTPESIPAPKETRLGPIYTKKSANMGRNQFTPKKYSKPGKTYFTSPLIK